MEIKLTANEADVNIFLNFQRNLYKNNLYFRRADEKLLENLARHRSSFCSHAETANCLLVCKGQTIGRFMLLRDRNMPEYVQVAFLEFSPTAGLELTEAIKEFVRHRFAGADKICYGLNGHLNHGLGILTNRFDDHPLFGFPYSADYYPLYFRHLKGHSIVTFRFQLGDLNAVYERVCAHGVNPDIVIRKMDRKDFKEAVRIYNYLNNLCFKEHPFWAKRDFYDDLEMIGPIKNLLIHDNLLVAEYQGNPVGFLLWLPDFNQLLKSYDEELKCRYSFSYHCRKLRGDNPIDTLRLAEVAVVEGFQKQKVDLLLTKAFVETIRGLPYKFCEGGFIFEENKASMNLTRRVIRRFWAVAPEIFRRFAVYEEQLTENLSGPS